MLSLLLKLINFYFFVVFFCCFFFLILILFSYFLINYFLIFLLLFRLSLDFEKKLKIIEDSNKVDLLKALEDVQKEHVLIEEDLRSQMAILENLLREERECTRGKGLCSHSILSHSFFHSMFPILSLNLFFILFLILFLTLILALETG